MQPGTICNLRVSSFKNQTKLWRLPCGQFYEESFPDLIKLVHMMLTLISSMAWMGIGDSPNRKGASRTLVSISAEGAQVDCWVPIQLWG